MIERLYNNLWGGVNFAKNNPQIIYTIFLLIVIPVAFLVSGQRFLNVALSNQERVEKERIGLMHDVFVEFASERISDSEFLQRRIERIRELNPSIKKFRVSKKEGDRIVIVSSLNIDEIGREDTEVGKVLKSIGLPTDTSTLFRDWQNGERHWLAYRSITDLNGQTIGFIANDISLAHIDDITEKNIKRAYIMLAFIIAVLFVLLIRHARIIDYASLYKQLKAIDKMKDDFISIASHELRTPLTAITWKIDQISSRHKPHEKERKDLDVIKTSADRLGSLIEDILNVSRIQEGRLKYDIKEVNINDISEKLINILRGGAEQKRLKLLFNRNNVSPILADPVRLEQILTNIVGNAIKYTEQGEVTVETSMEKDNVVLKVKDTGIGISAEDQKKLFQKFFRVRTKKTEEIVGTGLGLWIARELISKMNGSISVESIENVGSDFIISFPAAPVKTNK